MKRILKITLAALVMLLSLSSCLKDLDRYPTNDITPDKVYSSFEGYKSVMAKVYGSWSTPGSGNGTDDVIASSGTHTDFLRAMFDLQELTTDEAIYTHTSNTSIQELIYNKWTYNNEFCLGLYFRALFNIAMANEMIREASPSKVNDRGISGSQATEIGYFLLESRFLRAFQYWVLMDNFGSPPFVDESTAASDVPRQISRNDLFAYVERELLDIQGQMKAPRTNEYGRADQAAAWALLARLYLNAEVYTGTPRYTDAITFASKVIGAGYTLHPTYAHLFLADNNLSNPEVILSINYDGKKTYGMGGTTYMIRGAFIGTREDDPKEPKSDFGLYYGIEGALPWFSLRSHKELYDRFGTNDQRGKSFDLTKDIDDPVNQNCMFIGSQNNVDVVTNYYSSMGVCKFRNVTSTGQLGSNYQEGFPDTDFPLFRLAEAYFVYAEAVLRGGTGGTRAQALGYVNLIRNRATAGAIEDIDLTLDFLLDERSRELYWECFRRTDLVRYGKFTSGSFLWQWKGGLDTGRGLDSYMNIFPLPGSDISSNPNLKQNDGY